MSKLFGINLLKGQKHRDSTEEVNKRIRDTEVIPLVAGSEYPQSETDYSPASNLTALQYHTFSQYAAANEDQRKITTSSSNSSNSSLNRAMINSQRSITVAKLVRVNSGTSGFKSQNLSINEPS